MKKPKCILLDVEGTTSSISFVYDVMFPFVRENLAEFLQENWESDSVQECLPMLADELGFENLSAWFANAADPKPLVANGVIQLMDDDVKATGLKKLQGAIWQSGFESGDLVAHLFEEVAEQIKEWVALGIKVCIYSSGSVQAQHLFFGHTVNGNLRPLLSGHYDTTIGNKKEPDSYRTITEDLALEPSDILFISDVVEELDAAKAAGMGTVLSIRPGNKPVPNTDEFDCVKSFTELDISETVSNG